MIYLLLFEAAVIAAAFIGMLRLRRASDRTWRRHQILSARRLLVHVVFDAEKFNTEMRRAATELERMRKRIRKAMRESITELRTDDEKGSV